MGQGTGLASARRCQKAPPCSMELMPADSKTDPPLSPLATVVAPLWYLRRGKKTSATAAEARGENMNNSADTKVCEEGEGDASHTRAEIPLQTTVKTTVRQAVPPEG